MCAIQRTPVRARACRVVRGLGLALLLVAGCRSPEEHRRKADDVAAGIIDAKQREAVGRNEPFTIERPADTLRRRLLEAQGLPHVGPASFGTDALKPIEHWPEEGYPSTTPGGGDPVPPWEGDEPVRLTLVDALQVGARNSREYQTAKENIFLAALDLDLERNRFRNTFFGALSGLLVGDLTDPDAPDGVTGGADLSWERRLKGGAVAAASIGFDIVKLLTGDRESAYGLFADASITIPLLRGAGRHIVTEPLTQAERNVVYQIQNFERYKRTFAVRVATSFLDVLRQADQVANAEENYRILIILTRRTRATALAGRLPGNEVDQALQNELRSRDRWVAALQTYESRLDGFKQTLGLPPDARIELERNELQTVEAAVAYLLGADAPTSGDPAAEEIPPADAAVELVEPTRERGGPLELEEEHAIRIALARRQDVRVAEGRVYDAQRAVVVAADALRAGMTLEGSASMGEGRSLGSAGQPDGQLRPSRGVYGLDLLLDLPFERTAERNAYRESYIELEQAVRDLQELEDQVKADVRDRLRSLLQARESVRIQEQAVLLARSRVESTNLLLEAGRTEVRNVLEATEALISAQNARTDALIRYRVAELDLQRDLGVLDVRATGLWTEYRPDEEPQ